MLDQRELALSCVPQAAELGAVTSSAPPATAVDSIGRGATAPRAEFPIPDGGGCASSADWLALRGARDLLRDLRNQFQALVVSWDAVGRLQKHSREPSDEMLFSAMEVSEARQTLLTFLASKGFACSDMVSPHQPFLLDVWSALGAYCNDVDCSLPPLLAQGVPTGVVEPIPASGICKPVSTQVDSQLDDLSIHVQPWRSGLDREDLTLDLMLKDVAAGHAFELLGGEAEAKLRWGDLVAAGKLGIAQPPGKKPRLIGDGAVSGANSRCVIEEKVRLPTFESVQRFMSHTQPGECWGALNFDVRGAHKLVKVAPAEQGLSCFVVKGRWFAYRSCYFGCRWAAYWFSRVGAFLVRHCHQFLWVKHGFFLYVDDGLALFPAGVCPLLATSLLLFLAALGVPLSWEKVRMGHLQSWLGWSFDWGLGQAELPDNKRQMLVGLLQELTSVRRKVPRKHVERCVGLLVWFCGGAYWLKPWLQSLYQLLFKPVCVFRSLSTGQFRALLAKLTDGLYVSQDLRDCDVLRGWKLHSVWNCPVSTLDSEPLRTPRVRQGSISCVFYDYFQDMVPCNRASTWAAQFFLRAVERQVKIPLRVLEPDRGQAAADAFATQHRAGIGGWWCPSADVRKSEVSWFSEQLVPASLPAWLCAKATLQQDIASFEGVAQLCLLVARTGCEDTPGGYTLRLRQLCDNSGTAASARKKLTMQAPLCYVLQAIGFHCCALGVCLDPQHVTGVRNEWADDLSRNRLEGFNPARRVRINARTLLEAPWKDFEQGCGNPPGQLGA